MASSLPYHLSAPDGEFRIKGSRDPLGFQIIWQRAGGRILPHLSTVSNAVLDFHILCLAYHFFGDPFNTPGFKEAFIKFEQLCAYARFAKAPDIGFNGIGKVRGRKGREGGVEISRGQSILTNQLAYGVWGKYIRPFREIGIQDDIEELKKIYDHKMVGIKNVGRLSKWIDKCQKEQQFSIQNDKVFLQPLIDLLELNVDEKTFFSRMLLRNRQASHNQNELYALIESSPELPGTLYARLERLKQRSDKPAFIHDLELIIHTEKILAPLNRIFRLLQTKSNWNKESIIENEFIHTCKGGIDYHFDNECDGLNELLRRDSNWEIAKGIVERNKAVTHRRKAKPWMEIDGDYLLVNHREGAKNTSFDPSKDADNSYFLNTYLNLFAQLHPSAE